MPVYKYSRQAIVDKIVEAQFCATCPCTVDELNLLEVQNWTVVELYSLAENAAAFLEWLRDDLLAERHTWTTRFRKKTRYSFKRVYLAGLIDKQMEKMYDLADGALEQKPLYEVESLLRETGAFLSALRHCDLLEKRREVRARCRLE